MLKKDMKLDSFIMSLFGKCGVMRHQEYDNNLLYSGFNQADENITYMFKDENINYHLFCGI